MRKLENNFAFVDGQNVHLGILELGWELDWQRFYIFLTEKLSAKKIFLFLGFIRENQKIYRDLRAAGFEIIFKEILKTPDGKIKGNCDAELVLQTMIELENFDRAIIVSGDGDFGCLVRYLRENGKLKKVLSPGVKNSSFLLKKAALGQIDFLEGFRNSLEKVPASEKSHRARQDFS